ncbi:hypothetical protein ACRQU7_01435 [Caproiciproducens sp. R1]|uniref:hypothetical protein n=1 Tax=Caproiciproducens sp. R1 TaxID=3435000 RepID=UPI0040343499
MLKQFYRIKLHSFFTWGPVCILFFTSYIVAKDGFRGMEIYRILTFSTYVLLLFFPLLGMYSLSSLQFFQKELVILRFGSFRDSWKKCAMVLLLDSIIFVTAFHISALICYTLKWEFFFYFDNKVFFLQSFLLQCLTVYTFELFLMTVSTAMRNSLFGFLAGYLTLWSEKIVQGIHPTWNTVFFLAGMDWDPSMGLATFYIMSGIAVGLLVLVPSCFSSRDYLKNREGKL